MGLEELHLTIYTPPCISPAHSVVYLVNLVFLQCACTGFDPVQVT